MSADSRYGPITSSPPRTGRAQAPAGLENNPGKDGRLFSQTHPYFPDKCRNCFAYKQGKSSNRITTFFSNRIKDCYDCPYINDCMYVMEEKKAIRKRIRKDVGWLKEEVFTHPEFPHEATMSGAAIKEWLNQPHKHEREKNQMLYNLKDILKESEYKGWTIDKPRTGVRCSHIFETGLANERTWIVIHETEWGSFQIHSISDSERILTNIHKDV